MIQRNIQFYINAIVLKGGTAKDYCKSLGIEKFDRLY